MSPTRARVRTRSWILAALVVLLLVFAWVALPDPTAQDPFVKFRPPVLPYTLGTDQLGRDLASRLYFGFLRSVGLVSLTLAATLAVAIPAGLLASRNRLAESALDVLGGAVWSLPTLIICLVVFVSAKGEWIEAKFMLLGLFNWVPIYRVLRDITKQVRPLPFVTFARAMGMKGTGVYLTQILPNVLPGLLPAMSLNLVSLFEAEFFISFLGLSYPDPTPTLGGLLRQGVAYLNINMILLPSLLLGAIVLFATLKYQRQVSFKR
jgi:peptide/nickel transport system permease protein